MAYSIGYPVLGALLGAVVYWLRTGKTNRLPLPPGPKRLPLLGNIFNLPLDRQWLTFNKWEEIYKSDVLYAEAAGMSIVVLQSQEAITELLEKKSAIYSSRIIPRVINDLVGWNWLMVLMPYNDLWKERRRLFQKYFHPSDTSLHRFREKEQLHNFLNLLLDDPDNFLQHIRHMIGAITITMGYGIKVNSKQDPHVLLAEETIHNLSANLQPGTFLADIFYFLRHIPEGLPGTGWKAKVRELQSDMHGFLNKPYEASLKAIADGTATDSFVVRCQQDAKGGRLSEEEQILVKDMAAQVFIAGADTTVCAVSTFFLVIVCFPEVYKKAREEIDRVLDGRLPEHDDVDSLPYLSALLREVVRWQPVFPLGIFHSVTQDDEYKGYHIPKDSVVMPNVWALSYDPIEFPDPEQVKPERFLKDGKLHIPGRDPYYLTFGFGRRVCQGRHIAESTMFLVAATSLSLFDITKANDSAGNVIEPTCEFTTGVARQPVPFKCSIQPRSRKAADLIRSLS